MEARGGRCGVWYRHLPRQQHRLHRHGARRRKLRVEPRDLALRDTKTDEGAVVDYNGGMGELGHEHKSRGIECAQSRQAWLGGRADKAG